MTKRLIIFALIVLLFSACANSDPQPTEIPVATTAVVESPPTVIPTEIPPSETPTTAPSPTAAPTQAPTSYGPHDFPTDISPLKGKPADDIEKLERRPVAVKVQLFPRGQRPPWGTSLADVVFDYYQTFGQTRLHTIFLTQDAEVVGPVRSARLLDVQLVQMYQSIFAFGSAEQRTYSKLFNSDAASRLVVEGNSNCPPMCRVDPNGQNSLVVDTSEISTAADQNSTDNVRQNLDGMYFNQEIPPSGQPVTQAFVRFSISAYTMWDYNPDTGRYLRYQDTVEAENLELENVAPLMDQLTNEQVAADNVVVLLVSHQYAFDTHPGVNEVIDINLSGSGPAYAFRDGQVYQVVWNRPSKNSVLFLTFQDGSSYPFKPGNTWYEVVGSSSKLETPNPNLYRFTHYMP